MGKPYYKPPEPIVTPDDAKAAAESLITNPSLIVRRIEHQSALDLSQIFRSNFEAGSYFIRFGHVDKVPFTDADTITAVTVNDQTGEAAEFLRL